MASSTDLHIPFVDLNGSRLVMRCDNKAERQQEVTYKSVGKPDDRAVGAGPWESTWGRGRRRNSGAMVIDRADKACI